MNIKMPKGMNSPTVVIVGQGTMNGKDNEHHAKRMDMLEKKLDQQYEKFYRKGNNSSNDYSKLLKTFTSRIGSLEKAIKNIAKDDGDDDNEELLSAFNRLIKKLDKSKASPSINFSPIIKKLSSLENAIKNMPEQKVSVKTNGLTRSLNEMYGKIENAIMKARPRMIPSPS